jgi:carbamoyltransferase
MPLILGISAFYHDSAVALIRDEEILFAAHEERFTRTKHDPAFPTHAIRTCLDFCKSSGTLGSLADLDAVVFYDKPFLKFERLLETYYAFAPRGLRQFMAAMPLWIKEKLLLKKRMSDELKRIDGTVVGESRLLFSEHHLSHAASAFYPSPFDEAAIVTLDGVGEWATASIAHGVGNSIKVLRELVFPHSLGLLYSAFTYYLGFKVNSGEYKLMGLAPYGDPASARVAEFKQAICRSLIDVKEDGSLWMDQRYFEYAAGMRMVHTRAWERLFGFSARQPESSIEQHHCDLALAIQQVTDEIVVKIARTARELTGSRKLCLAGGVALNCVSNARVLAAGLFDDIWVQPASGDAGGALGAALSALHLHFGAPRTPACGRMRGALLGPAYSDQFVAQWAEKQNAPRVTCADIGDLCGRVTGLLADGKVVGWFQGRMEWGPRALGNRSILGDARSPAMQKTLNLAIKKREGFRPFAPAVLSEKAADYFDPDRASPYMLFTAQVKPGHRKALPSDYHSRSLNDKLYFIRSDVPAITHIDYSARLQTVDGNTNGPFWRLIDAFERATGCPMIINTSFNVRGEPIVCTPEDAYRCFMTADMDYLAIGNLLFDKKAQPPWSEAGYQARLKNRLSSVHAPDPEKKRRDDLAGIAVLALVLGGIGAISHNQWFLYSAGAIAAAGLVSRIAAAWTVRIMLWIGRILGAINSRILLALTFGLLLTPIALVRRLFNRDSLKLAKKPDASSYFTTREYTFGKADFRNMW